MFNRVAQYTVWTLAYALYTATEGVLSAPCWPCSRISNVSVPVIVSFWGGFSAHTSVYETEPVLSLLGLNNTEPRTVIYQRAA